MRLELKSRRLATHEVLRIRLPYKCSTLFDVPSRVPRDDSRVEWTAQSRRDVAESLPHLTKWTVLQVKVPVPPVQTPSSEPRPNYTGRRPRNDDGG